MIKSDYNDYGKRVGYQEMEEPPGAYSPALTDLTHLEKIYEFPIFTVTQDTTGQFDWDGYTWEIDGVRHLIRDVIAVVLEDADTGDLFLWNGQITFSPVSRYGDHLSWQWPFGCFFKANQHSVTADIFFRCSLPAKNATVFLATSHCSTGGLLTSEVNQGGKAIVKHMNQFGEIIGYKELGPIPESGKIYDFLWEDITDMKGNLFIPDPEYNYYQIGLILVKANETVKKVVIK